MFGAPVGLFTAARDSVLLLDCNDAMAAMPGFARREHCLGRSAAMAKGGNNLNGLLEEYFSSPEF